MNECPSISIDKRTRTTTFDQVSLPIDLPNRRKLSLRIAEASPQGIRQEVTEFCKWNQLPEENVPNLARAALKGVNPNAFQL